MNLNEENLKAIISYIECYGSIVDISVKNNETVCLLPKKNEVFAINLNRPNEYTIKFIMGDTINREVIK